MAQPQSKRITELDLANPLTDADEIAIVQDSRTKRATMAQVLSATDTSCECSPVSRFTQVGNAANTLRQYLHTWQAPSTTLPTTASWMEIKLSGQFAANTDDKIIYLDFGTDSVIATTFSGSDANSKFWELNAIITRATQTTQTITGNVTTRPRAGSPATVVGIGFKASGAQNLGNTVNVKLSVQTSTSTASNILVDDFHVLVHYLDANS